MKQIISTLNIYSFLIALLFASCGFLDTSRSNPKQDHKEFMQTATKAKDQLSVEEYYRWLNKTLNEKKNSKMAYEGYMEREDKQLMQYESTENLSNTNSLQDINSFKADRSRQQLKGYDQQKKILEKEIFYLKSQISALEEKNPSLR